MINLIEHLPYNSHLREAQLNDEWYVVQILEAKEKRDGLSSGTSGVPVSEWSREVALLSQIGTDIRGLTATVQSALGAKGSVKPYDGPSTIVGKAEKANRQSKHENLAGRVLGKRKG